MGDAYRYVGSELDLFRGAENWKKYWTRQVGPYLEGDVLEVGAGIGGTTEVLPVKQCARWVCLEPDKHLARTLTARIQAGSLPSTCEVRHGTTAEMPLEERFGTILYADVLEHIEDDAAEIEHAAQRLRPNGRLIVLAPAHQWLYAPFDRAIGHYRRYTRASLLQLEPVGCRPERVRYLDSCGLVASLGNRFVLKRDMPEPSQIALWDSRMVPVSTRLDPVLGYRVGKSILVVWQKGKDT